MLRILPTATIVKTAMSVASSAFKDRLQFVADSHHPEATKRKLAAELMDVGRRMMSTTSGAGLKELTLPLSALSRRLGTLDYPNLKAVYNELKEADSK